MVLNTQRQIDKLEQESDVTQTIDNYNVLSSPYVFNLWDYKNPDGEDVIISADNWVVNHNSIRGVHGTDRELLTVQLPPLLPLEHKLVTKLEIVTDIIISGSFDNAPVFNSVSVGDGVYYQACHSSTDKSVVSGENISNSVYEVCFTDGLWGYDYLNLTNLLQKGLYVQFNIDLSSNRDSITFQNTKLKISFEHFFESESKAVENRLQLLGYKLTSDNELGYLLYIEDGYLYEEYTESNAPIFSIETKEVEYTNDNGETYTVNEGWLMVEGEDLPDYKIDSLTGELYFGEADNGSINLLVYDEDTDDGKYYTGDNIIITISFYDELDRRVPNRDLILSIGDSVNLVTTGNDGYYTIRTVFNKSDNYLVSVVNKADDNFNECSNSVNILVED